jgi:hypothetical protein
MAPKATSGAPPATAEVTVSPLLPPMSDSPASTAGTCSVPRTIPMSTSRPYFS